MKIPAMLLFVLLAWTILFLVHALVYNAVSRVFSFSVPYGYLWVGVAAFSYFAASFLVRTVNHISADRFYFLAASWLGFIFLAFSGILVYEIVHISTGFDSQLALGGMLVGVALLSVYALYNGRDITVQEYTLELSDIEEPLRIAHLSDIHVGTVHQTKYLEEVVAKTNALNPDMVLVTGDLFDGSAPIDEEILTSLNSLTAPSFFSNGNHEEYEGLVKVRETIKNLDMRLLDNEMVVVKGVQIAGVNDRQSIPRSVTLGAHLRGLHLDGDKPTILMYHSPVEWDDARANGVDLMLSGHTHNGQVYPFNLLVRLSFKYINGLYEEGGKYLHVSPGTGTWGPPMRLGSRNQVTVLHLEPAEEK